MSGKTGQRKTRSRTTSLGQEHLSAAARTRASSGKQNPILGLQHDAGNQAVSSMLPKSGSGKPLDAAMRQQMEASFGEDFSSVRLHTDAQAAKSAQVLTAQAYTVGQDIVFGKGRYAPNTGQGQRLLAHELTHVVQQDRAGRRSVTARAGGSESLESEAQKNAALVGDGQKAIVSRGGQVPQIQYAGDSSGLAPEKKRKDPYHEEQRLEAINIVQSNCSLIWQASKAYRVPAVAIAGAILWEALEHPNKIKGGVHYGPGKVHLGLGEAESDKVEEEGLITPAENQLARGKRLQQPPWAILYIAAIMRRHANVYKNIAGVDISDDPGILCTLYQAGRSEERAQKLAERRKKDPTAMPSMGTIEMGMWVENNRPWIEGLLLCS